MNKRFFTLIAGLLLTLGVGSVGAQDYAFSGAGVDATKIENGKYYQLGEDAAAGLYLTMEETKDASGNPTGLYHLEMKTPATAVLPNSLWQAVVSENAEGGISFTFVNKMTGLPLGFDPANAIQAAANAAVTEPTKESIVVGSTVWKWQVATNPVSETFTALALSSAFKKDSVMTLVAGAAGDMTGKVYAVKFASGNVPTFATQIEVLPVEAGAVLLGVDDLNSMLWSGDHETGKVKFTFDKDVDGTDIGNLFSKNEYKAVPAVGFPAEAPAASFTNDGTAIGTSTDISAITDAEEEYYESLVEESLAKAIATAIRENEGANHLAKQADVLASVTSIAALCTGETAETAVITKLALKEAVNNIAGSTKSLQAVKTAINDYIDQTLVEEDGAVATMLGIIDKAASATTGIANLVATAATTDALLTTEVKTYTTTAKTLEDTLLTAYETAQGTFTTTADDNKWLSLQANDETDADKITYLMTDTSFVTAAAGDKHLTFAIKTFKDVGGIDNLDIVDVTRMDLNGRFNFQFVYYPTSDSIVIRTAGFAKKQENTTYWTDMTTDTNPADLGIEKAFATPAEATLTGGAKPTEGNLIKIAVLADDHREVTVGSSEYKAGSDPLTTINTRIYIGGSSAAKTTLSSGLYFMTLKTTVPNRLAENGGYKIVHLSATEGASTNAPGAQGVLYAREDDSEMHQGIQNFAYVPATQWVVEQTTNGNSGEQLVNIYNREYPSICLKNVQLYTDNQSGIVFRNLISDYFSISDTLAFAEVSAVKSGSEEIAAAYKNAYTGYFHIDESLLKERNYALEYLSGIGLGNYINVSSLLTDTILRVSKNKVNFILEKAPVSAESTYGYSGVLATGSSPLFPQLKRTAYALRVKDANKLVNDSKYVVKISATMAGGGEPVYGVSGAATLLNGSAKFLLKENNRLTDNSVTKSDSDESPFFALVDAIPALNSKGDTTGWSEDFSANSVRMGVKDGSLYITQENKREKRVAAFRLYRDRTPLYRRLGESDPEDQLEDNNVNYAKIYTINSAEREYLYEDANSKYSIDANGESLGINFLGLEDKGIDAHSALFIDTAYVRNETNMPQYMIAVGVKIAEPGEYCPENPEHNTDEYLNTHGDCGHRVWMDGYVDGRYLINAKDSVASSSRSKDYIWNTKYTRLAFVQARHIGDTLVIFRDGKPGTLPTDSIFLGDNRHNMSKPSDNNMHPIHHHHTNGIKNPVFAFRLIDDKAVCDFLIESEGDEKIPSAETAGWVKIQNGVPVIANYKGGYNEAISDAEIFNIEQTTDDPVSNDTISTDEELEVIAGEGEVGIRNATGETVAISNLLGQNLVTRKLTSDNETIEVSSGVVIVSVGNRGSVKVVVR